MYVLASMPPLTILTHCHPTPGMVVVGAGVCHWWLLGGCLSNDGASRVVGDDHVTAVMWRKTGGRCWRRQVHVEAGPTTVVTRQGPGHEEGRGSKRVGRRAGGWQVGKRREWRA